MDLANEATNASGNAEANQEKWEESLSGKMQKISTQWDSFWLNFYDSGATDAVVDSIVKITGALDDLSSTIGGGTTMGLLLGGGLALNAKFRPLQNILKLLKGDLSGVTSAVKNLKESGGQVVSFLSSLSPMTKIAAGVATAAVAAYAIYQKKQAEALANAQKSVQQFSENNNSLNQNIAKVQELKESLASGTLTEQEAYQAKSDLLSIQNQLTESYGSQAEGIDLVNGKLDDQIQKMQQIQVDEAKKQINEEGSQINKAQDKMGEEQRYNLATTGVLSKNAASKEIKSVADEFEKAGITLKNTGAGAYEIKFVGNAEDAEKTINDFMNRIREKEDEFFNNGGDESQRHYFENIISSSEDALEKNQKILDDNEELAKQGAIAEMMAKGYGKDKPIQIYEDYKKAVEDYNEALKSGDTSSIEKAKKAFDDVSSSVANVTKGHSDWKSVFDDIGDSLDTASIKVNDFKEALGKSKDIDTSVFKDLTDADLKGISFDDKTTAKGEEALKAVVDKAIELGVVSDDSAESVQKVVDILVEMGVTASVSTDSLMASFQSAQESIEKTVTDISSLQTILSESMSGSGISSDNLKAFREMFGDDAEKALERTANGYHINQKALAELQAQQKENVKTDYLEALADQQEALRKVNEQIAEAAFKGSDISGLLEQKSGIESNISSLQDLAMQYKAATSAYQQWQAAMSGGEEGDMYDSIYGNIESADELLSKGLIGTNKFREFADLISNQDLSKASAEEAAAAYEEAIPKIKRYFTEGEQGAVNFLNDVQNLNSEWAHLNEDGNWELNVDDQQLADSLNLDVEAIQAIMRKLKDYGFVVNLDEPIASLEELKSSAQSAKEALDGMNDTSLDGINLESDSFSEVTDQIGQVKDYIQEIEDSDLEPDVKADKLEKANQILEYLVGLQDELGSKEIELNINADEIDDAIEKAQSALDEFKNEDGTVDVSVEGAGEAVNNLQALLYAKEQLNQPAIMNVDSSAFEGALGEGIAKVQEFEAAVQQLNVQKELQAQGVDIDTSAAEQKVATLAGELRGLDGETKATLGLDTSEADTALANLQNSADINGTLTVNSDDLTTIQNTIISIPAEITGDKPADEEKTVTYNAKIIGDKPKNENMDVTYTAAITGNIPKDEDRDLTYHIIFDGSLPSYNGTANPSGAAFAHGTSNSIPTKNNWKTKKSEIALTGEVGQELVVNGNRWWTVGDKGAEFSYIPSGSIIFNSKQTKELLGQGYTNSRGTGNPSLSGLADLSGTAYSSATGGFYNRKNQTSTSGSGSSNKSSSSSKSSGNSNSNSNSNSDSEKDFEEIKDWIEIYLKRQERITNRLTDAIEDAVGLVDKQSATNAAIAQVQAEIAANQKAMAAYQNKANSIGLSESYKKQVRDGTINIETIKDEDLKDKIDDYTEWYLYECHVA